MKQFRLSGEITFQAEHLEDALARLAYHFLTLTMEARGLRVADLRQDEGAWSIIESGSLELRPTS